MEYRSPGRTLANPPKESQGLKPEAMSGLHGSVGLRDNPRMCSVVYLVNHSYNLEWEILYILNPLRWVHGRF